MHQNGVSLQYTSKRLRQLNINSKIVRSTRRKLFYCNILQRNQRKIDVIVTLHYPLYPINQCNNTAIHTNLRPCPISIIQKRIPMPSRKKLLPSLLLTNAQSLTNKMGEFDLLLRKEQVNIAVVIETWAHEEKLVLQQVSDYQLN